MRGEFEKYATGPDALATLRSRWVARTHGETSPPAVRELFAVHALYALSAVLAARAALAFWGSGRPIGANALDDIIAMAAVSCLMMGWFALGRTPSAEKWFISHLLWLTMTFAVLGGVFAGSLIVLAVVMLLVLVLPPLFFLAYLPAALAWVFAAWFVWRLIRGYSAFLRRAAIGRLASG